MKSLELINNSVEFARELSLELYIRSATPSEEEIQGAIDVMNQYLWGVNGDIRATFRTEEAYLDIPDSPELIETLSHSSLEASKVEHAIVRGKIDSFKWLGSTGMSSFGLHMKGVDLIAPYKSTNRNAFLPVDGVSTQFAA